MLRRKSGISPAEAAGWAVGVFIAEDEELRKKDTEFKKKMSVRCWRVAAGDVFACAPRVT